MLGYAGGRYVSALWLCIICRVSGACVRARSGPGMLDLVTSCAWLIAFAVSTLQVAQRKARGWVVQHDHQEVCKLLHDHLGGVLRNTGDVTQDLIRGIACTFTVPDA